MCPEAGGEHMLIDVGYPVAVASNCAPRLA